MQAHKYCFFEFLFSSACSFMLNQIASYYSLRRFDVYHIYLVYEATSRV